MTYYAVTNIDGGEGKKIVAGDKVTKSTFTDEEWEGLLTAGAVAEPDRPADLEPDERDAKIAELEAKLAELMQTGAKGDQGPETPRSNPAGTAKPKASGS